MPLGCDRRRGPGRNPAGGCRGCNCGTAAEKVVDQAYVNISMCSVPKDRGLPAPRWPEQAIDLAGGGAEVDAIESGSGRAAAAETQPNVFEGDGSRRLLRPQLLHLLKIKRW